MKLFMGLIILLVTLVAVTGCTQTASSPAQTTTETTVPATEVTTIAVPVTTTEQTPAPTENVTTAATVAPVNVTPTVTAASGVTKIHITSTGFTPQTDVVLPGTNIAWVNDDTVNHGIMTTGNNTGMFNSGDIIPTGQFQFSFSEKTGTYTYALADNKTITGTIIVKAGRTLTG